MKLEKLAILFLLLVIGIHSANGQFYKRLSVEIGASKSKIFNTGIFFPNQFNNEVLLAIENVRKQSPAITTNYSASLGIRLSKNHSLRVRHSRNRLGNYITGNFCFSGHCGFGNPTFQFYNELNQYINSTLGLSYELILPIKGAAFTFGLGYEKQWNIFHDTRIMFPYSQRSNRAIHSYFGILVPMNSVFKLHTKCFVTRIAENIEVDETSYHFKSFEATFIPLQVGIEVGVRLDFYNL